MQDPILAHANERVETLPATAHAKPGCNSTRVKQSGSRASQAGGSGLTHIHQQRFQLVNEQINTLKVSYVVLTQDIFPSNSQALRYKERSYQVPPMVN